MRIFLYLLAGILIFKTAKAVPDNDTIYILFKKDNLRQSLTVQSGNYQQNCAELKEKYSILSFVYRNVFQQKDQPNPTDYEIDFIHNTYFDTLPFTKENILKQKKQLLQWKRKLIQSADTTSTYFAELKRNINRLNNHLTSKFLIDRKSIDALSLINLSDLKTAKQVDFLNERLAAKGVVLFLIDGSDKGDKLIVYTVGAIPLLPIRGKHMF
jgi:hypothetical protein